MADGEPNEGYVDVGWGKPSEGGVAAAPPAGDGVAVQPVSETQVGSLMDPGPLFVNIGGGEHSFVPPPAFAALI